MLLVLLNLLLFSARHLIHYKFGSVTEDIVANTLLIVSFNLLTLLNKMLEHLIEVLFRNCGDLIKHGASLYLKFEVLKLSVVIIFKTFHWLKNFESCSVVSVARRQCCFASEK